MAQTVKHLSTMRETWVWPLGRKDPLEKEMVTHSSILAWRIPWTEKPGKLQSTGSQRFRHDWATSLSLSVAHTVNNLPPLWEIWVWSLGWEDPLEKEMTIPLQYSCLENSHGQRNLVGYCLCGHKGLDMIEWQILSFFHSDIWKSWVM